MRWLWPQGIATTIKKLLKKVLSLLRLQDKFNKVAIISMRCHYYQEVAEEALYYQEIVEEVSYNY